MMTASSEDSLKKLTKPKLIAAFMNLQTKKTTVESMNNKVIDELRELNPNLEVLQSERDTTK